MMYKKVAKKLPGDDNSWLDNSCDNVYLALE